MAIRVISSGTTIVKSITVGTPTRIGDIFNGNLIELNDVDTTNLEDRRYLRYDSATETFKFVSLDSDGIKAISSGGNGIFYDSNTGEISIDSDGDVVINNLTTQGDVLIKGGLRVQGTYTHFDTNFLTINDKLITVADSALDSSFADGAGIEVFVGNNNTIRPAILWSAITNTWDLNRPLGTTVNALQYYTTAQLTEDSTNLYYTRSRFDSALGDSTSTSTIRSYFSASGDLVYNESTGEFSVDVAAVYTTDDFDSDFNVAIDAAALNGTGLSYDSATNTLSITDTGVVAGTYGSASLIPVFSVNAQGQLDSITEISVAGVTAFAYDSASGLLTISTADGATFSDSINLAAFTTSTLAEGSNLYYTTARADSDAKNAISSGGNGISYNNTTGEISIDSSSSVTVNNLNVQQNLLISGNLTVNGDTTTVNSVTVTINDKNLVLADSATDSAQADGAGLTINGANATITYVAATDTFDFNKAFGTGTNVLSNYTTSQLAEGSNLYYTDSRVQNKLANISGDLIPDSDEAYDIGSPTKKFKTLYLAGSTIVLGSLTITDSFGTFVVKESNGTIAAIDLTNNTTTNLAEGINLYYTRARVDSDFDARLAIKTTSDLAEGSNLYYTTARADSDARYSLGVIDNGGDGSLTYSALTGNFTYTGPSAAEVRAHFSASGDLTYDSATGTFSIDVEEVYTAENFDSDLDAAISGGVGLTYDSATNTVNIDDTGVVAGSYGSASLIPIFSVNAQGQIDSINEVSVAGVTNFVYDSATGLLTISTADGATFSDSINLSAFSTSTLAEGSNLYYTKVRVDSDVAQGFTDRTTDDLTEGDNLYYTRDRFDSALGDTTSITTIRGYFSAAGDLSYDSATGTFSFDVEQVYTKENFDSDFNIALDEAALGGIGLAYNSTTNTLSIDSAELAAYFSTDDITEGSNLYYTTNRADSDFDARLATKSTSDLTEGSNLYYTALRADSDARYAISVSDLGGDGSLTYSASTGVISYTGPSAAEVRAHFSGGANVIYDSATGVFTLDSDVTITGDLTARQFLSTNTQLAKPSKGNYSGERVRLYDFDDVNKVNYAIGVEASHVWFSVDTNLQGQGFKWYGDSVQIARLNAIGDFEIVGDFTAATLTGKYLGFDSDFGDKTTTNLTEGSNLYYTTARADSDAKNAISAGTGVIYDNTTGVIAIGQAVDSNADVYFDQLTIGTNLVVEGNFQVNGTQTIINTQTLSVTDNMIYLNSGESDGSPTQFIDIGFAGNYNDVGSYAHAGLFRDATDGVWKFYDNYAPEPDSSPQIDVTHPSFRFASLRVSDIQGIYLGFDSDLGTKTTDDLTEGSNLYYTQDRFDSAFDDKTTSDLTEGSNLYYTTNRADSDARHAISVSDLGGDGSLTYSATTGVITYTGPSAAEVRAHFVGGSNIGYDSSTGVFDLDNTVTITGDFSAATLTGKYLGFDSDFGDQTTDDLTEGSNLYYTTARGDSDFDVRLATKTTTDLTEGSNLYYTRDRFDSALGDTTSIGTIRGYFSAAGDLSYDSATGVFSFDVEQVYTKNNFDSDFNAALDEAALNGTGLSYDSATNTLSITDTGVVAGTYGSQSLIPIISVNAQGQIDSIGTALVAGVTGFSYDSASGLLSISTADGSTFSDSINLNPFTTTDLGEGSNLYYTTNRVDSDFDARLATKSTTDLAEGDNLYYLTSRFDSDFGDQTTDDLTEGSNLYYTRGRFDSALGDATSISTIRGYFSSGGDITYDSATGQFSIDVEVVYTADNFDSDLDAAVSGGVGISYDTNTNAINIDSAELGSFFAAGTDRLGVAQFDSDQFIVTAGYVSINVIDGGSF
jgi:hypothetical protein